MNIQKSLYECLLCLGVNMTRPQEYMCSEVSGQPDLVLGFLKWGEGGMYLLLANYRYEDDKALPDPEVVLWVSPREKKTMTMRREWRKEMELDSISLDIQANVWLDLQILRGHRFHRQQKMSGNVVPLPTMKR